MAPSETSMPFNNAGNLDFCWFARAKIYRRNTT